MNTKSWLALSVKEQCKLLSQRGYLVATNGVIFKCVSL